MNPRTVRVQVQDSPRTRFFYRDELLSADPVPKLLVSGLVWRGDLAPVLDAYLEQLQPLDNGLTPGRTLSAEEVPAVLDLGATWLGAFRDKMLAARANDETAGIVDLAEVLQGTERAMRELNSGSREAVADALRRLRRAADAVGGKRSSGDARHPGLMGNRHTGDFSRPNTIASINDANSRFWATRGVGTSDGAALRDAVHAASTASVRDRNAALNDVHRAFWAERGVG